MPDHWFSIKGVGVLNVRIEATGVLAIGGPVQPVLVFRVGLKLTPPQGQNRFEYTVLSLAAKLSTGNNNMPFAYSTNPPLAERSNNNSYERPAELHIPLSLRQIKHIEDTRAGGDPVLRLGMGGLVALHPGGEFERLQEGELSITVPQSHWIDVVLKPWKVSDLRLLEIDVPTNEGKDIALALKRLAQAEKFYRTGDHPHVLTELRSAFAALAQAYGAEQADKNAFDKMLVNSHPKMRDKLRESFHYFCSTLHLGAHEPTPTAAAPVPVSRQDSRLALVTAHAIFEYFSSENWPGL